MITSYDHDNQPTRMEVTIEKLDPREEFAHEFRVPERTHRIETFVEAKVESLSGSKKVNLRDNFSISINGIDQGTQTASPFFIVHRMDLFWKSGAKMGNPSSTILSPSVLNMWILDGPEIIPLRLMKWVVSSLDSFPILNGYR